MNRYITLLGNITFAILALLSLLFWKERTIILDASFQSFYVINKGELAIQVQRFGAAFVQAFPLVTSKLGLPLKIVLMSYSLAFILFQWLSFFICDKILKDKNLALCVLMWYMLMTAHTFYWAQNELIQGISLMFVYFGILAYRTDLPKLHWWQYPLSIGLIFTLVYFHPLMVFPFCFVWAYFLIHRISPLSKKKEYAQFEDTQKTTLSFGLLAWSIAGFIIANYIKFYVTGVSSYDKNASERLSANINSHLSQLLVGHSQRLFWGHCFDDFALVLPFLLGIIVFYIWKKKFLKLALFVGSSLGLIFIIGTTYLESKDWFYLESQYLPLSVILAVPFIFDVLPTIKSTRWAVGILIFILSFKILYIFKTHYIYTDRYNYLVELLDKTRQFEGTKFCADNDYLDQKRLLMHWGAAYETLYISALKSPDSTRSIVVLDEPTTSLWIATDRTKFQTIFDNTEYAKANHRYFNFQDTLRGYKFLKKEDFK